MSILAEAPQETNLDATCAVCAAEASGRRLPLRLCAPCHEAIGAVLTDVVARRDSLRNARVGLNSARDVLGDAYQRRWDAIEREAPGLLRLSVEQVVALAAFTAARDAR